MSLPQDPSPSALHFTFATWLFELHVGGVTADDPELADACRAVAEAQDEETGEAAGNRLVARVGALLSDEAPATVQQVAISLFGERASTDLGEGDREARLQRIRKYQFSRQLPWLALVWERTGSEVHPTWLLIERITDVVHAMDPNPWDDIDEERALPLTDFHVLWELGGCASVYIA